VTVYRDDAVCIFVYDDAVRIHAECADIILEFFCSVYYFALVKLVREMRENNCGKLHAHTEVDAVGFCMYAHLLAYFFHPFASASADGNYTVATFKVALIRRYRKALICLADVMHGRIETEIHACAQIFVKICQHDIVYIRSEVADGSFKQIELILNAYLLEF